MATMHELRQCCLNIIAKGIRKNPDGSLDWVKVTYPGVLNDIHNAILLAYDLRKGSDRDAADRIVANLAHMLVLIQSQQAQELPDTLGRLGACAGDLLMICAPSSK